MKRFRLSFHTSPGPRGSALLAVLMVSTILLVVGMALLSAKSSEYAEAARLQQNAQARVLAESGLVDFETKVIYGFDFPPAPSSPDNPYFVYTEEIPKMDGSRLGAFTVKLDRSMEKSPQQIWKVTSTGTLGAADDPVAVHTCYAELDVSPNQREDQTLSNPNFLHWVNFEARSTGGGGG